MIRTFLNEEKSYIGSHCNRALSKQLAAPVLKKKKKSLSCIWRRGPLPHHKI